MGVTLQRTNGEEVSHGTCGDDCFPPWVARIFAKVDDNGEPICKGG